MPGVTLNLVLGLATIPGEIISAGAVHTIAHSIEASTVALEMAITLGSMMDTMLDGTTQVAVEDSLTITGGEEMTTDMPISLVVLRADQLTDMIFLKADAQA